jgi:hypothetical protein
MSTRENTANTKKKPEKEMHFDRFGSPWKKEKRKRRKEVVSLPVMQEGAQYITA